MKYFILSIFIAFSLIANAQQPVAKVDINMSGRREAEVNKESYTPWDIGKNNSSSITVSGVTFELQAVSPEKHTGLRCYWSKALVQSPYNMKLVSDGVKIDKDSLAAQPGKCGAMELHIKGLPVGLNTIQTYHNIWEDNSKVNRCPINVYLNGKLVHKNIVRSMKATKISDATLLFTKLNVTKANQEMVLRFEASKDFNPAPNKPTEFNVCLNGFELNTRDASKLSHGPIPANEDRHVDATNGSVTLKWQPATNNTTKKHIVYFGTDSSEVANAKKSAAKVYKGELPLNTTQFKVNNLYSMNTYYWRVDQVDSAGTITKGNVWQFRPRQLAFPGAEGYGRFAIGGRGGKVVYVTNLKNSGPGSFRDAVENQKGSRTILFNVSGIITLKSRLVITDNNVTVAGQTAPGKGICFRWAPIGVIGDDLIFQFIRMRVGIGITYDGLGLTGANNSIIDHSSISWTIDEAFSSRGAHNITLQRTLISEALNQAGHANYRAGTRHGYAASIGGDIGSFHHNLLAHCEGRNWSLAGGLDGDGYYAGRLDITNNVVYNWGHRATDGGAHEVNFVNNYYKKGAASSINCTLNAQLEGTGKGSQSYYYSGNILAEPDGTLDCDGTDNKCGRIYKLSNGQKLNWELWKNKPFFPSYVKTESAKDAFKTVLSDVGCNQPVLDKHDTRVIEETLNGTYSTRGSKSNLPGLPDNEKDVGGWEYYPGYNRASNWDSDSDGLPDWWEKIIGTNPDSSIGDFSDSNADSDKDGYTNLEEYLHWMSNPHYFITKNENIKIVLKQYSCGYNKNPEFEITEKKNCTVKAKKGIATVKSEKEGLASLTFSVTDKEGSSLTRQIVFHVGNDIPKDKHFEYKYYKTRAKKEEIIVR